MRTPRQIWSAAAITLIAAACQDATGPSGPASFAVLAPATSTDDLHILRQDPSAPALETYQVSFWARKDRAQSVTVNYLPAAGESEGRPFLRFDIPARSLSSAANGDRLGRRDSVLITLTIDPTRFSVDFAPSGVVFARRRPATLAIWYGNASPDLNDDGTVDAADQTLADQLAIWSRPTRPAPWLKTVSQSDAGQWLSTALYHFSEYAVSW